MTERRDPGLASWWLESFFRARCHIIALQGLPFGEVYQCLPLISLHLSDKMLHTHFRIKVNCWLPGNKE